MQNDSKVVTMNEVSNALAASASKRQHEETVSLYADLMTTLYDKTTAYLNAITVGGYAAFLGMWSLLGKDLPPTQRFWSALLLGVSILLFTGFEIIKAAILHWQIRSMLRLSSSPYDPLLTQLRKHAADYDRAQKTTLKLATRLWIFIFPATVLTGVFGALVMLYAVAAKLFTM